MQSKEFIVGADLKLTDDPFAKIEGLKQSVQNRITRNALRRALLDLKNKVKAAAPKDSGALRMSIGIKVGTRKNTTWGRVGPRMAYSKFKKGKLRLPWRYAGPLVRGHGTALGNDFYRVVFNRNAMLETLRAAIEQGIDRELEKRNAVPF